MSFISLMLSQQQVVISLVLVGLILLAAVSLMVGPALYRSWKRAAARRKAHQAEQAARRKKAKAQARKRTAQADSAPAKRATVIANQRGASAQTAAVTTEPTSVKTAEPVAETKPAVSVPVPAPVAETKATQPETQSDDAADVQDILNSVFADEGKNERFEVLMQGVEVPSAEELLALASRVNAQLRTIMVRRETV